MSKALTLSGLMALLLPKERLFVIHHLGADISEAVAGGTVEELERTRCVEVCGNNIVERIAVDVDDWPDTPAPILLVTIGGKVKTHEDRGYKVACRDSGKRHEFQDEPKKSHGGGNPGNSENH